MKWFKHMSNAHEDPRLVEVRLKFGTWGLGVYWDLLGRVARQMGSGDELPKTIITLDELCSYHRCKRKKLARFLEATTNLGLYKAEANGLLIDIKIPKLLKVRDNHSRNLQVTCKRLASKEVEVEVEVDKKKKDLKNNSTPPGKKSHNKYQVSILTDRGVTKSVADAFVVLRRERRAPITEVVIKRLEKQAAKANLSLHEVVEMCCANGWQGFEAKWIQERAGPKQDFRGKNAAWLDHILEETKG